MVRPRLEQNTFTWSYDDLGRLIGEVLDSSDNTLDYTDTFEWDVVGNRLETSRDWGDVANDDYTTTYQYDANDRLTIETKDHVATSVPDVVTSYSYDHTQQTGKSVVTDGVPTSNQLFEYDLQGRMASVTNQTLDSGGNVVGVQTTEYEYDTAGNRVVATNTVDANNDGTPESVTRTEYLTDANNPTGYSQVIEETEFDDQGNAVKKIVYTIGHDQISQSVQTWNSSSGLWSPASSLFFGYDGHGSVRVLYDAMAAMVTSATNNVLQLFHFDAHGNLLNMQAVEALTSYLYSGEAFDSNIGQQYLRARWYDATTGRFNRLDPFFGNLTDPQSLHKYLYVHGDPVNGIDPSGLFTLSSLGFSIATVLNLHISTIVEGVTVGFTLSTIGGAGSYLRSSGLRMMSNGFFGLGLEYYRTGTRIMSAAFFAVEMISLGIGLHQLGLGAMQLSRLAASKLLTRPGKLKIDIAGQKPTLNWNKNPSGVVRSENDIIRIARANGVNVPDNVKVFVDDGTYLKGPLESQGALGPSAYKPVGGIEPRVRMSDLVDPRDGKFRIILHPDALKSDEAIAALMRHEMYEIEGLARIIAENGGSISLTRFIQEVSPGNPGGFINLHDEAWDAADDVVKQMRGR